MKVIFLDIDGVLNGYGRFSETIFNIAEKLHLIKLMKKIYPIYGVHPFKVFLLSLIVRFTGATVIMTSTWRGFWYDPKEDCPSSMKHLKFWLKVFNVEIASTTGYDPQRNRSNEIREWIIAHDLVALRENTVKQFVILDDETFDLQPYIDHVVHTYKSRGKYKMPITGLKFKHVIAAIRLLNKSV